MPEVAGGGRGGRRLERRGAGSSSRDGEGLIFFFFGSILWNNFKMTEITLLPAADDSVIFNAASAGTQLEYPEVDTDVDVVDSFDL